MHTLWARTAKSRTCQCSSCFSAATGIARRTTTAAGRRRIKFGEILTVFYSSLLASAAVADSQVKDSRRKQLDDALTNAKKELEELKARNSANEDLLGSRGHSEKISPKRNRPAESWVLTGENRGPPRMDTKYSLQQTMDLLRQRAPDLDFDYRTLLPGEKSNEDRSGIMGWESRTLSHKKLRTLEYSVAKLAIQMLLTTDLRYESADNSSENPTTTLVQPFNVRSPRDTLEQEWKSQLEIMRERLAILAQMDPNEQLLEAPRYPNYGRATYQEAPKWDEPQYRELRQIIRQHYGSPNLDLLVSRICFNLLKTRSPPNVHIYNLLIRNFSRLKQNHLVDMVLESMFESHIRPTPSSLTAILKHFADSNDVIGFRSMLRRLDGLDGGLYLQRFVDPKLQLLFRTSKTGKVVQKAIMNKHSFGALINGSLKLSDFKQAKKHLAFMTEAGYTPGLEIHNMFLKAYAMTLRCKQKYWKSGLELWSRIQAIFAQDQSTSPNICHADKTRAYYWMLRLCRKFNQVGMYYEVLNEAAQQLTLDSLHGGTSDSPSSFFQQGLRQYFEDFLNLREGDLTSIVGLNDKLHTIRQSVQDSAQTLLVSARAVRAIERRLLGHESKVSVRLCSHYSPSLEQEVTSRTIRQELHDRFAACNISPNVPPRCWENSYEAEPPSACQDLVEDAAPPELVVTEEDSVANADVLPEQICRPAMAYYAKEAQHVSPSHTSSRKLEMRLVEYKGFMQRYKYTDDFAYFGMAG